jgi:phosphoglycerate dehydrogenase-like enzyme
MQVTLFGQHAHHAPRLRHLLGSDHEVTGVARLPPAGPIASDVLIGIRLGADEAARVRCALLQVPGAGLDAIAIEALPPDIRICNVFEHEIPIAEFVAHAALDHAIFPQPPASVDPAHWPQSYLQRPFHGELQGRRAAIVGFGAIGRATAMRLRALGMHVTAVTRGTHPVEGSDAQVPVTQLDALLSQVDALVLCCPLTEQTRGMIGAAQLAAMRPDALLVNVGRGPLVQEQPLYEALVERRLGRAVLDVWYHYPTEGQTELAPSAYPFHTLPNARCTPHISGWTNGLFERRYAVIARNIERLQAGEPLLNLVR